MTYFKTFVCVDGSYAHANHVRVQTQNSQKWPTFECLNEFLKNEHNNEHLQLEANKLSALQNALPQGDKMVDNLKSHAMQQLFISALNGAILSVKSQQINTEKFSTSVMEGTFAHLVDGKLLDTGIRCRLFHHKVLSEPDLKIVIMTEPKKMITRHYLCFDNNCKPLKPNAMITGCNCKGNCRCQLPEKRRQMKDSVINTVKDLGAKVDSRELFSMQWQVQPTGVISKCMIDRDTQLISLFH